MEDHHIEEQSNAVKVRTARAAVGGISPFRLCEAYHRGRYCITTGRGVVGTRLEGGAGCTHPADELKLLVVGHELAADGLAELVAQPVVLPHPELHSQHTHRQVIQTVRSIGQRC